MINEIFKVTGVSIYTFKRGDIIIRVEPAIKRKTVYDENLKVDVEVVFSVDHTLRDTPCEFICIENNIIYLKWLKENRIVKLLIDFYDEGWAIFKIPEGLTLNDCI